MPKCGTAASSGRSSPARPLAHTPSIGASIGAVSRHATQILALHQLHVSNGDSCSRQAGSAIWRSTSGGYSFSITADATVYTVPRALLEPWRAQVTLSTTILQEATGGSDPVAFRAARLALLQAGLKLATDPVERAGLGPRISELDITDPNDRRTISMEFIESRHYELDGPTALADPAGWLAGLDTFQSFPCDVVMGSWDSDALSAYYVGTLALPTH